MQIVGNMGDSTERVIKNRPHRLNLVYTNQPLYFVTFATRDRKKLGSLKRAQLVLEAYGQGLLTNSTSHLGDTSLCPTTSICLFAVIKILYSHRGSVV